MKTIAEFTAAVRQIMTDNGIGGNTLSVSVECMGMSHRLADGIAPDLEYKALVWVKEEKGIDSKLESFRSSNPTITVEKIKLYFQEKKLSESATPQQEFEITPSYQVVAIAGTHQQLTEDNKAA